MQTTKKQDGALPKGAKEANIYIILKAKDGYRFKSLPNQNGFAQWKGADVKLNGVDVSKVSLGNKLSDKPSTVNTSFINRLSYPNDKKGGIFVFYVLI